MAKRGLNIYKRKDGRWEGRYKCGYNSNGKIKYRSVYGKSFLTVKDTLEKIRSDMNREKCRCDKTVNEIIKLWLHSIKSSVKESTYSNYVMKAEKHIIPFFDGMKYDALTAEKLNEFISEKIKQCLSEKYISDMVILIKSAVKYSCRNFGYIKRIEFVSLPKRKTITEKKLLSESEQQKLRSYLLRCDSLSETGILLASTTGIRIGELCALKWSDINLEKGIITIRSTVQRIKNTGSGNATKICVTSPKSSSSVREIPVPDFMVRLLKKFRSEPSSYFLTGTEKIAEPRLMQYRFGRILKKLRLTKVTFHSLRHMFATNCVALGFDIKTLSEILGHSSVKITLDRYVHSSVERKRSCMNMITEKVFIPSKFPSRISG